MSKINLDISQKIDIDYRAGDTFSLSMSITNEDGSPYSFDLSGSSVSDDYLFFTIYDNKKQPIIVLSSNNNASFGLISNTTSNILTTQDSLAIALQNLLGSKRTFKHTSHFNPYYPLNYTQPTAEELKNSMAITPNKILEGDVSNYFNAEAIQLLENGGVVIQVDAPNFILPLGKYDYDLKIASSIENYSETNRTGNFTSSRTWMYGSFTVKKD
jgi:hypothetical protein